MLMKVVLPIILTFFFLLSIYESKKFALRAPNRAVVISFLVVQETQLKKRKCNFHLSCVPFIQFLTSRVIRLRALSW